MTKEKKKRNITSHIIAFLVGVIVTAFINFKIEDYFKRPVINSSLDCVNIIDNEDDDLILNLYTQFENIGQTNTSITVDKVKLQFKGVHDKPFVFNLSKRIEISALSFSLDTIKVILPKSFDTITQLPKIQLLSLTFHELKKNKQITIKKDSTNAIWSFMGGEHIPENPDSFSYHPDYVVKNGQTQITGRKIPINYKGKTYTCIMYPREAHVSYKVENDKIHLTYGCEIKMPAAKNGVHDILMKPLIFIPAPEIEDKCILPNGFEFSLRQEIVENNEIIMKNYSVKINDMRDTRKQIVYFLN